MASIRFLVFGLLSLAMVVPTFGQFNPFQDRPRLLVPTGAVPAPALTPTPTIWHALGFPQGLKRVRDYRDSRLNKDGNSPQKERKPQLKPLADKQFLTPEAAAENPLLNAAAKAKVANDLAPQKIKALKYISSLGCGCPKQPFVDAILDGLKDCVCEVRMEAIRAVMTSAERSGCGEVNCVKYEPKKKRLCSRCQGGGCEVCSYEGAIAMGCGELGSCGACGACCSKAVQDHLKDMATKQDDSGCYLEPNADIRALAQQALDMCPPLPPAKQPEPEVPKVPVVPEGPQPIPAEEKKTDGLLNGTGNDGLVWDTSRNQSSSRQVNYPRQKVQSFIVQDSSTASTPASLAENRLSVSVGPPKEIEHSSGADEDYLIACNVMSSNGTDKLFIAVPKDYHFPEDSLAYTLADDGTTQTFQVLQSRDGKVILGTTNSEAVRVPRHGRIRVGIIADQ